ncbi:MAG: hypothetical protein AAGU11_14505 [Syntrophobacteraceae bacterium]
MAKANLLLCLEKRDLLNQSAVPIDKLVQWGERYQEAGLVNDAVDFYERANASDALEGLLPLAFSDGDAFLYGRVLKALGRDGTPEEWVALGDRAKALGKRAFALEAYRRGGLEVLSIEQQGDGEEPST